MGILGKKKSRRNPLYGCGHRVRKGQKRPTKDCPISRSLRSEIIDDYTWNTLVDTLSQSHLIKEQTKSEIIGKNSSYTKRSFNNKIKKLNQEMMGLDNNRLELEKRFYTNTIEKKRYDVLISSIEQKENELMGELQTNQMKLDSLDHKEQEYMEELDKNNFQIQTIEKKSEWIDWLDVHFSRMDEIREITDFKNKRGILHHYIHEIIVLDYNDETKQHTLQVSIL